MNTIIEIIINFSLSDLANLAVVVCSLTALATLSVGIGQFRQTQLFAREAQAVDLFAKFNQLNIEQRSSGASGVDRWYGNSKIAITEALFEMTKRDESWKTTVSWMLDEQKDFIEEGGFVLQSYSSEFRAFCEGRGFELRE